MADQHLRQLQREFEETQSASAEEALLRHKVRLGELSEQGFRLRLLELHWEATGSPADEAKLLAERVRALALAPSRLRLAAALGHSAAVVALSLLDRQPASLQDLERLFRAVDFSAQRAALAAARWTLDLATLPDDEREAAEHMLQVLSEWIACPCERHQAEAEALSVEEASAFETCFATKTSVALSSARSALFSCGPLSSSFGWRTNWGVQSRGRLRHALDALNAAGYRKQVCEVVRVELVPWLLGYGDPVR